MGVLNRETTGPNIIPRKTSRLQRWEWVWKEETEGREPSQETTAVILARSEALE